MGLYFRRNGDGTTTGQNEESGFSVTLAGEEEAMRRLCGDAGWECTPPPPPVPPGYHRFSLVDGWFGTGGFADERYAELRARPPVGCVPVA